MPEIKAENESGVRVNSVGTILEVIPKPKPTPKETVAKVEEKKEVPAEEEKPSEDAESKVEKEKEPESKPKVLVSENIPPPNRKTVTTPRKVAAGRAKPSGKVKPAGTKPPVKEPPKEPPAPNPLESIHLVVLFKDGKKIERPMSEVIRFNVDKGILTIVLKDGTIARHSLLDVEKVTIE
jgi:hypothetical protein